MHLQRSTPLLQTTFSFAPRLTDCAVVVIVVIVQSLRHRATECFVWIWGLRSVCADVTLLVCATAPDQLIDMSN